MLKKFFVLFLVSMLWVGVASAKNTMNIDPEGLAIKGYDPVSYFDNNKAVKGNIKFEYQWNGALWRFVSKEHKELFSENPKQYVPEYGGYCAFAMFFGQKADIDPKSFTIIDGKLYLNNNLKVKKNWEDNTDQYIFQADQKWTLLQSQEK